jgi:hypothetical protein
MGQIFIYAVMWSMIFKYQISLNSIMWSSSIQNSTSTGQEKFKPLVYMHSCHQVWLSLLQFSQSSCLLDSICKNTYTKFNRSWTNVWPSQTKVVLRWVLYFIKNAQHWWKKTQSTIIIMMATGSLMLHFVPSSHELNAKSPIWLKHSMVMDNSDVITSTYFHSFIIYYFSLVLLSTTPYNHLHGLGYLSGCVSR